MKIRTLRLILVTISILLISIPVHAQTIMGKVFSIADGNTITILNNHNQQRSGFTAPPPRKNTACTQTEASNNGGQGVETAIWRGESMIYSRGCGLLKKRTILGMAAVSTARTAKEKN